MLSPGHAETECLKRPGLKALQPRPLDQLAPQASEAVTSVELAEVGCQSAQLRVGDTRCITVTSLESYANSGANSQCEQVPRVKVMPGDRNSGQKIHSGQGIGIAHEWQIDEIFDRTSA